VVLPILVPFFFDLGKLGSVGAKTRLPKSLKTVARFCGKTLLQLL